MFIVIPSSSSLSSLLLLLLLLVAFIIIIDTTSLAADESTTTTTTIIPSSLSSSSSLLLSTNKKKTPPSTPISSTPIISRTSRRRTDFHIVNLKTEYLDKPLGVDKFIPRVSWQIELINNNSGDTTTTTKIHDRGIYQKSYLLQVSKSPAFVDVEVWDCNNNNNNNDSSNDNNSHQNQQPKRQQQHLVPLKCDGLILQSDTNYYWRVTVTLQDLSTSSAISNFRTGLLLLNDSDKENYNYWSHNNGNNAKWITGGHTNRLFRSPKFYVQQQNVINYATLFVSGIGYYECYINGDKVGNHKLDPGWTDYAKRVYYTSYDVTSEMLLLSDTEPNMISVILGNGWWSCGGTDNPGSTNMPHCTNDPPQLILQLNVNGKPLVVSNAESSWKVGPSPIIYDSLYNGEIYDSRISEKIGPWKTIDYDDSKWEYATLTQSLIVNDTSNLKSQLFEPIKYISSKKPISITQLPSKSYVIDFGQNQAAVVEIRNFTCGDDRDNSNITIRHGEILQHPPYGPKDGSIYTDNLRSAQATDTYICNGNKQVESYKPTFTQHGFRYVEITGLQSLPQEDNIIALELHSDVQQTSTIKFSNPLLNEIQHIVIESLKSNMMSVPTDCNQRDERRGWMGDAAITSEAATLNYGMGSFYTHWLQQIAYDGQYPNGGMPNYVPTLGESKPGSPNWQSAYIDILWSMLTYLNDKDIVFEHHESIVQYFNYLEYNYNQTGLQDFMTGYGDWVPPKPHPKSDGHLMGAFAFIHDVQLGIQLFTASYHPDASKQADRLTKLESKVRMEFHTAFYNSTSGVYMSGLQTEQALALFLGSVPKKLQDDVVSYLINDIIETNNGHTTCGIVGIKYLMEALSRLGHDDIALQLALQTTYPSWGYMIHNDDEPATTLWELWSSNIDGPSMNSRNHHMFGSITSWFYKYVAGIQTGGKDGGGYEIVHIVPHYSVMTNPNLTSVDATVATPYGNIVSSWKTEYHQNDMEQNHPVSFFELNVCLPPGTRGIVRIPVLQGYDNSLIVVTEGNIPFWIDNHFEPEAVVGVLNATLYQEHKSIETFITNGCYHFHSTATKSRTIAKTTKNTTLTTS